MLAAVAKRQLEGGGDGGMERRRRKKEKVQADRLVILCARKLTGK
jgi:hypothetical protein